MKKLKYILSILGLLVLSQTSFAQGGDSSAGGGPGNIRLVNWKGALKLEAFAPREGLVANVLKFFILAGAEKKQYPRFSYYSIPNVPGMGIHETAEADPASRDYFHLQIDLKPTELVEMGYGNGLLLLSFSGPFAERLFQGMAASGLEPISRIPDKDHPGEYLPGGFMEGALRCEIHSGIELPTSCTILGGDWSKP